MTVQHLREVTRSHFPSIVFLSETHQHFYYVDKIRKQFGYYKGCNADHINKAGGLSLWWKPDVNVDVLFCSKFFIDSLITCNHSGIKFRIT